MSKIAKIIPRIESSYEYVFGYLEQQRPFSPNMIRFVVGGYELILKRSLIVHFLSKIISFKPNDHTRYVFVGRKYKDLLRSLPRNQVLVIGFWKDWLYCLWFRIPFRSGRPVVKAALDCYREKGLSLSPETFEMLKVSKAVNPKFLLVYNDSLPVERIYCLIAKSSGAYTICIQHGIFTANSPPRIYDGGVADLMLAIDRQQLELMKNGGVPACKLGVVGFHSNIVRHETAAVGKSRVICILGQPWGAYYPKIEERYLALLEKLVKSLSKSGLKFVFKPHPNEVDAYYVGKYGVIEYRRLAECFERYDVFISFTSTALVEASLAGRVAIQIFDPVFMADNFSDLGYSHSIDSSNIDQLGKLICEVPPIRISYPGTIAERFKAAIQSHTF